LVLEPLFPILLDEYFSQAIPGSIPSLSCGEYISLG